MLTAEQQCECEKLIPYAMHIARSFSKTDDEYESEAMLALCCAVDTYDESFGPTLEFYVGTCVRNRLGSMRKKIRHGGLPKIVYAREETSVFDAIEGLPDELRALVQHRWIEQRTWKELKRITGKPVRDLRAMEQEARAKVRSMLDDMIPGTHGLK